MHVTKQYLDLYEWRIQHDCITFSNFIKKNWKVEIHEHKSMIRSNTEISLEMIYFYGLDQGFGSIIRSDDIEYLLKQVLFL